MPRNTRHHFSLFGSARMGLSTFRRGETVPALTVDFSVALAKGETLASATWYCSQPYSVVMSNPTITRNSTAITLNCQYQSGSLLKIVATTSTGAVHSYQMSVEVKSGYWFQCEQNVFGTGPYRLYVDSGLSITGHLPDSALSIPVTYAYTVVGDFGPNVVTLVSGALPTGLVISPSGVVTGTPTVNGTFNWGLLVTDSRGLTDQLVDSTSILIVFGLSGHLPDCSAGALILPLQYVAHGGTSPYGPFTIHSGSLPTGLAMDVTGLVTGTPTTSGTFNWQIQAYDATGSVAYLNDSNNVSNYVAFNPASAEPDPSRLSNGNRILTLAAGSSIDATVNTYKSSGKWYLEYTVMHTGWINSFAMVVIATIGYIGTGSTTRSLVWFSDGSYTVGGPPLSGLSTWYQLGNVIGVAFDATTRQVWVRDSTGWLLGGDPGAGTGAIITLSGTVTITTGIDLNDVSGYGPQSVKLNCGQDAFVYTIPTGFVGLSV